MKDFTVTITDSEIKADGDVCVHYQIALDGETVLPFGCIYVTPRPTRRSLFGKITEFNIENEVRDQITRRVRQFAASYVIQVSVAALVGLSWTVNA